MENEINNQPKGWVDPDINKSIFFREFGNPFDELENRELAEWALELGARIYAEDVNERNAKLLQNV